MNDIKNLNQSIELPVKIKCNLTGRKAAIFARIANLFKDTKISLSKNNLKINAKSVISIRELSCQINDYLIIETIGDQAKPAIISLVQTLSQIDLKSSQELFLKLQKELSLKL